jgi:hypothetical protein
VASLFSAAIERHYMNKPVPSLSQSPLLQECLSDAIREARMLMEKLVDYTRVNLRERESAQRNVSDRSVLTEAIDRLARKQTLLVDRFVELVNVSFQSDLSGQQGTTAAPQPLLELRFDQLELMDEGQVQSRVELARAQQMTQHAVEGSLPELNTLTCALQGLHLVQPDRNPFRPEIYLRALQQSIEGAGVSSMVRMAWTQPMCALLGKALHSFYGYLNHKLRERGVKPAGYAVTQATEAGVGRALYTPEVLAPAASQLPRGLAQPAPVSREVSAPQSGAGGPNARSAAPALFLDSALGRLELPTSADAPLLTVDRLRQLLTGDQPAGQVDGLQGVANQRLQAFAQQFEREFELRLEPSDPVNSDFQSTLPAAFDALDDEGDIELVLQRLAQRQALHGDQGGMSVKALSRQLKEQGHEIGQAVALEVITHMVDNIVSDGRLRPAVRKAIETLRPALMQLAVVDPRFFSDRLHPARRLLDQVTQRSLAFESDDAPGFAAFMAPVIRVSDMLATAPIDGAAPFEVALREISRAWSEHREAEKRQRENAVKALMHAEQRNLLAGHVRQSIRALPELAQAPPEVREFLLGPWSQVVAQSRLGEMASEADPGGFFSLVSDLLWSVQPELTRANGARLTRLIPGLLGRLREGLKLVDYPPLLASAFLEKLIVLHQAGYRKPTRAPAPPSVAAPAPPSDAVSEAASDATSDATSGLSPTPAIATQPPIEKVSRTDPMAPTRQEPSITPQSSVSAPEASSGEPGAPSNNPLQDLAESDDDDVAWLAPNEARDSGFLQLPAQEPAQLPEQPLLENDLNLPLGAWVDLRIDGGFVRTQLTWASPHGTLFLFTRADGSTQSMTRRMRDRLVREGNLRLVAGPNVVNGALDEVARTALRNTVSGPGSANS